MIEDYIAASRVGDTLSYVETAKLSSAEAADSSTSRIWDQLLQSSPSPEEIYASRPCDESTPVTELTCAEGLVAGQVVFVNSRGLIEGKRDEADNKVGGEPEPPAAEDNDSMFN